MRMLNHLNQTKISIKSSLTTLLLIFLLVQCIPSDAQVLIGNSKKEVNFREGPGLTFKVAHSIDNSNMLVILPVEEENGFSEVFDVETSTLGYVYTPLIEIVDTLRAQPGQMIQAGETNLSGEIEIVLKNRTDKKLFVWINQKSYFLSPYEKKFLEFPTGDITYFISSPGLFPIFGKEFLEKGATYNWNLSL